MNNEKIIESSLSFLGKEFIDEITKHSILQVIPTATTLIREGQYIKYLPIVLEGIVKVYSQFDNRELLLYYIQPQQSCIISFSAAIYNKPSKIYAITEEESVLLLAPADKVNDWISRFPRFNKLFFDLYHDRYLELLDTIHQLLFNTLDKRIILYLKQRMDIDQIDVLDLRHHEIAKDLGTAREVVSRVMKKLEKDGIIIRQAGKIRIIDRSDQGHHIK